MAGAATSISANHELFVNVPEEERRKIIADNAVGFWNLGS